ncbi:MAG: polysaccharide lyase family 8 super-sandwich domain-containing protein, partial [Opitutaceae bacterium]
DGRNGAAAMDIAKEDVQARKAWFCFPAGLVCLGCDLRSAGPESLTTSLNQCRLMSAVAILGPSGWTEVRTSPPMSLPPATRAVLQDGIGYILLQRGGAVLSAGPQTGSWSELRKEGVSAAPVAEAVFSLWLDHGPHPKGASYAYALLPRTDRAEVERFARAPAYRVLANRSALQAVFSQGDRILEAAFHAPGEVLIPGGPRVAVDAPCLVMVDLAPPVAKLCVSDPTEKLVSVRVAVGGKRIAVRLPRGPRAGATAVRPI